MSGIFRHGSMRFVSGLLQAAKVAIKTGSAAAVGMGSPFVLFRAQHRLFATGHETNLIGFWWADDLRPTGVPVHLVSLYSSVGRAPRSTKATNTHAPPRR